jgi:hypothetical protein
MGRAVQGKSVPAIWQPIILQTLSFSLVPEHEGPGIHVPVMPCRLSDLRLETSEVMPHTPSGTRPRALAAVILSTGTHYDERFEKRPFDVARDAPNKKGGAVAPYRRLTDTTQERMSSELLVTSRRTECDASPPAALRTRYKRRNRSSSGMLERRLM